eukprot:COSAG02_NODE_6037_length_3854_cov_2.682823_2_plen_39_part_00
MGENGVILDILPYALMLTVLARGAFRAISLALSVTWLE